MIGSALIPLLAHGEERIVVLFSTRPRDAFMRALSARDAAAFAEKDAALASVLEAPPRKLVRLVSIRADGTLRVRDVPASEITEAEDTIPA